MLRLPVDVRRFPWVRRLAADYAYDFGAVAPFFSGDPADRAAWAAAIDRTQRHERRRPEIAGVLAAQQARRAAPPPAVAAAAALARRDTVAVVTGQQAGLFGGPLFTLLKALTAIKLAERVSRDHGVPSVAIFWVDAEDHDWDEVRACSVFDGDLAVRTVALPARPGEPGPIARVRLDESAAAAIAELESILPATEFRSDLIEQLRGAYAPGAGMADAFGRWLERVLGARGLVVFDSSDPASKPLLGDVFARELSAPGQTSRLAARAGADLVARGYHSQVHGQDEQPALFHLESGRRAIRRHDGELVAGETRFRPEALARAAREAPALFSPNVLLRPIAQDTLFPTVAYVAGPSELAYLGQLRGVYAHFGVPMPLMYPRASATLLDSGALRFLARYELPLEALQARDEAALNTLLQAQIPPAVEESFDRAGRALEAELSAVARAAALVDPTLDGAAQSTLGRMRDELHRLHGKMIHAAKRRDETLRRQFNRTRAQAFPDGHAQERTIGFLSFLNQYGPALLSRLDDELPLGLGTHWVISV
ncbi:MAG: bacillithiol biosynthesis cysteine-adding enzyme BshC [Acidobacteria bacterium]|nr:bacillithiol biosynthesis cysteine-adding enzyme BshC [Acidobacteriota bacterium]